MKRTMREDSVARATRIVRDRAYRATGYDAQDETYQAIVWALSEVRSELRKADVAMNTPVVVTEYINELLVRAKEFGKLRDARSTV